MNEWEVIERDQKVADQVPSCIWLHLMESTTELPVRRMRAFVRANGCVDITIGHNFSLAEEAEDDLLNLEPGAEDDRAMVHLCNLQEFHRRIGHLLAIAKKTWGTNWPEV